MNNESENLILSGQTPLRGQVKVQSSTPITIFLLCLSFILNKKSKLLGDFNSQVTLDFLTKIRVFGFEVMNTGDTLESLNYSGDSDNVFFSGADFASSLILTLMLAKRGGVEVLNNKDLISFYNYLGFEVKGEEAKYFVSNKVGKDSKSSITFHTLNEQYYYIAILTLLLNNKEFSISSIDLTYELNILIELLKELGFVKDVVYGNFITVNFDFTNVEKSVFEKLKVPGDPKEYIFYCVSSIATGGEIEVVGLDPKMVASTLKVFSSLGVGFESISESSLKIWWGKDSKFETASITDTDEYLDFTKLCLIPCIATSLRKEEQPIYVSLNTEKYRSYLQDINILGGNIEIDEKGVTINEVSKIKGGKLTLSDTGEIENYARLIIALTSRITIKDFTNLVYYNHGLLNKLESLGGKIEYDIAN